MPPKIAKVAALSVGVLFILLGILGFVERYVTGSNSALPTDPVQDVFHLGLGLYLAVMGGRSEQGASFCLGIGALFCLLFAGGGYYQLGDSESGRVFNDAVHLTKTSCWLHFALAGVQALGAMMNTSKRQLFHD